MKQSFLSISITLNGIRVNISYRIYCLLSSVSQKINQSVEDEIKTQRYTFIDVLHRIITTKIWNKSHYTSEKASKLVFWYRGLGCNHSYVVETFGFRVHLFIQDEFKNHKHKPKKIIFFHSKLSRDWPHQMFNDLTGN